MASPLRLVWGLIAILCTVAVGAPDEGDGPVEKKVFPLLQEDDVWWAGIADVCEVAGAEFSGDGFSYNTEGAEGRLRIRIGGVFTRGPLKITTGEDSYEFELGKLEIKRNGEHELDFIQAPKRLQGVPCATLEDLAALLDFEVGEEADGQPTIEKNGERYRLVQGESKLPAQVLDELPNIEIFGDGPGEAMPGGPLIMEGPEGRFRVTARGGMAGGYVEHHGSTYRAGVNPFKRGGGPAILYGPVVGGLTYLSIVHLSEPRNAVVLRPGDTYRVPAPVVPNNVLPDDAQGLDLSNQAKEARRRAVEQALETLEKQGAATDEIREQVERLLEEQNARGQ